MNEPDNYTDADYDRFMYEKHIAELEAYIEDNDRKIKDSVVMPKELTAENGGKYIFMGEFEEVIELECPQCDQDDEDCECCNGNGTYTYRVPVSWDMVKSIYALAVKRMAT